MTTETPDTTTTPVLVYRPELTADQVGQLIGILTAEAARCERGGEAIEAGELRAIVHQLIAHRPTFDTPTGPVCDHCGVAVHPVMFFGGMEWEHDAVGQYPELFSCHTGNSYAEVGGSSVVPE